MKSPLRLLGLAALVSLPLAAAPSLPVDDGGSAVMRNGSGINPNIYVPLNTPCIGTTWQAEIDLTGFGWGLVFTFAFAGPLDGVFIAPYGEILVDPASSAGFFLDIQNSNEGYTLLNFPIPNDPSLIGQTFSAQGLFNTLSMIPSLTNAVDITVGA